MSEDPWIEAEREQLARWAKLTYAERLEWLWQAKLFAQRALAAARAREGQTDAAPVRPDDAPKG